MNHQERFDAWLGDGFSSLSHAQRVIAVERAFSRVWNAARPTLGDITLAAIGERVWLRAKAKHPLIADTTLDVEGLKCDPLRHRQPQPSAQAMEDAARTLFVDLLTVLGNLTAEIITPALHNALARAGSAQTIATSAQAGSKARPTSSTTLSTTSSTTSSTSSATNTTKKTKKTKKTKNTKPTSAKSLLKTNEANAKRARPQRNKDET